jgi:glutamate-1-semialdehyde 2,1-aminomutase
MNNVYSEYRRKTPASRAANQRSLKCIAGGLSRGAARWQPYPLTMTDGKGLEIRDVDGNVYFDLTGNYGSMIHGHAYPPVVEAISDQIAKGTQWAANNLPQIRLAEILVERIASVDAVRFVNSGSEAAGLALSIARHLTGRPKVLIAAEGYHGSLWEFGMQARTGVHPADPGATLAARFGDAASFEAVLNQSGKEIAAVFVEPVAGVGGMIEADAEFLSAVQKATRRAGAVFVLDEVLTFRLGRGGKQESLGLEPDLTMLGKIIGGGFPVGAVGGKEEIMAVFGARGSAAFAHSGTYNGNPISMLAGEVTLRELTPAKIDRMATQGAVIAGALRHSSSAHGLPVTVYHVGSFLQFVFDEKLTEDGDEAIGELAGTFHLALLNRGLLVTPRGMIALSTVMTDTQTQEVCRRLDDAFGDLALAVASDRARTG